VFDLKRRSACLKNSSAGAWLSPANFIRASKEERCQQGRDRKDRAEAVENLRAISQKARSLVFLKCWKTLGLSVDVLRA